MKKDVRKRSYKDKNRKIYNYHTHSPPPPHKFSVNISMNFVIEDYHISGSKVY